MQQGGGRLFNALPTTDIYGLSFAQTVLGPGAAANVYGVTAGNLSTSFTVIARLQTKPFLPNGVVSAANYSAQPAAPGSYVSIFGAALAETTQSYSTPYLPVSLSQVSVSLPDTGTGISVPGHIAFISAGTDQCADSAWELQGQASVQMKVSIYARCIGRSLRPCH